MSEEVALTESRYGRVVQERDGSVLVFIWQDENEHIEMVRFDPEEKLLRIFPKKGSSAGLQEQFDHIREIQIDTAVWAGWDPDEPTRENLSGDLELSGLPEGFGTIFSYGLGLPRKYRGFIRNLEEHSACTAVRFGAKLVEGPSGEVFHVGLERFANYKRAVDKNVRRGATVVRRVNQTEAHNAIAGLVDLEPDRTTIGRHPMIQAMTRELTDDSSLDAAEREVLVTQMSAESRAAASESPRAFGKLRKDVELVSLEVLIEQFGIGLQGAMAKDEARWQTFFEENTFALQQLFASPVAMYGSQLRLRMTNMHGAGGRIADFVLINTVTRSAVVVEIKTPATPLLGPQYRGSGGAEVFPPDRQLAGAVAQIQAQMESARTDFQEMLRRTTGAENLDTCVIHGAVIAGTAASLSPEERSSFLRYRSGLNGIDVIAFDEVRDRLSGLHHMLATDADNSGHSI